MVWTQQFAKICLNKFFSLAEDFKLKFQAVFEKLKKENEKKIEPPPSPKPREGLVKITEWIFHKFISFKLQLEQY